MNEPELTPIYLADPVIDAIVHVTAELAAELWAVKRRMQLLEAHLVAGGLTPPDEQVISDEGAAESGREAKVFIENIFKSFRQVARN
jgi:hypothetical protein